jgi:hypothetical protein
MKNMLFGAVIVVAIELLASQTGFSQGTVYISTLNQPSAGSAAVGSDSWLAVAVTTGGNSGGYALDSIELDMTPATGDPSGFTVQLYSMVVSAAPSPGGSLGTLTGSTDPVSAGLYTYTASGLTLSPSTEYFIVLSAETPVASGACSCSYENTSPSSTSGGWLGGGYYQSSDGIHWTPKVDLQFSLTATAVPEPDTLVLMGLPGLLFFACRRWRACAQGR